jgi:hypothetical protein
MNQIPKTPKYPSFARYDYPQKKRLSRCEKFQMAKEQVLPWADLEVPVKPTYHDGVMSAASQMALDAHEI